MDSCKVTFYRVPHILVAWVGFTVCPILIELKGISRRSYIGRTVEHS